MITIRKERASSMLFNVFLYTTLTLLGVFTLYPFLNVLALSLNDYIDTIKGGITLWPRVLTFKNYEHVLSNPMLIQGLKNSVIRTAAGSIISVTSATMFAYTLSRKDFFARRVFSLLLVITMYVSGGIIPVYLLYLRLGLVNNFLVYILPTVISAWNVIVMRSYMDNLPISLQESAKIDGANDFTIYLKVILPLCMPVIATITLFAAVGQWNSWFDTYLYCSTRPNLTTLQYELRKVLSSSNLAAMQASMHDIDDSGKAIQISPESIRMAITIVVTLPILLVYPFLQRYFVKGVTIGAVKG